MKNWELQTVLKFRLDLDYWNHSVVEKRKMVRVSTNQGVGVICNATAFRKP